jgi:glutathione S-transferase
MKLINATPSPYGRKVAIALKEKAITYEVMYDIPWAEETIVPQYSPLQQLPILITDDGKNIYDSAYILDWLELRYPVPALLPVDIDARLQVMQLRMLAERLAEFAQVIAFEVQRPDPSTPWLDRQKRKVGTGLAEIAKLVGNRKPGLKESITLGDIAAGCTFGMFDVMIEKNLGGGFPEFEWRKNHLNLLEYATALFARPSFQETQPVMFDVSNLKKNVK